MLDLARAASRTFDIEEWVAGFGSGPDDLTALDGQAPGVLALRRELAVLDLAGAVGRLAGLANAPCGPRAEVAIATGPGALEALLAAFEPHAADASGFWLADAGLVIRFRCHGASVAFKAHHPVLHQAIEDRCARQGFDLA